MGLFDDPFKIEKQDWELKAEEDEELCAECDHKKMYHNVACTYCGRCMGFRQ